MASKEETAGKKPNIFKQIIQIYQFTHEEDKALPWLLALAFLLPIVVVVVLALVFHWSWIIWIFTVVIAIMVGALLFTMLLTRRADKIGYTKIEGQPGAAASVLSNINRAGFNFPQEPVWVDARTKETIWRGTGYSGVFLIGEGDYERIKKAMDRQEMQIKGVTAGSDIPVYRIYAGTGSNQTKIRDLRRTVVRQKTYVPTNHSSKLLGKLHPRRRFVLTKEELGTLNDRLHTVQIRRGYGIPKGIDPTKPQRVSRKAMRGR